MFCSDFWNTLSNISGLMFSEIYIWFFRRWPNVITDSSQDIHNSIFECCCWFRCDPHYESILVLVSNELEESLDHITDSFIFLCMFHFDRIRWYYNGSNFRMNHIVKWYCLVTRGKFVCLHLSAFWKINHMMIESSIESWWLKMDIFPILSCHTEEYRFKYIMIIGSAFYLHIYFFYWWYRIRIFLFCKVNYLILSCSTGDENHLYISIHDRTVHSMRLWRRG